MEQIRNETLFQDTHNFIYKNKNYPFKFLYFLYSSDYFNKNRDFFEETKDIHLIDRDVEDSLDLSDHIIHEFIDFVQLKDITLSNENVCQLQYLAKKYGIQSLIKHTEKYILYHQNDIVIKYLLTNQNSLIDLDKYENIISANLFRYITDERMIKLNISILYRILEGYFKKETSFIEEEENNNDDENNKESQILDFLFKCLDNCKDKSASILLQFAKFKTIKTQYYEKLLDEKYINKIDFLYLNHELAEILSEKMKLIDHMKSSLVSKKECDELESQNKKLKKDIVLLNELENTVTIDCFNFLSLSNKQSIIFNLIEKSESQNNHKLFLNINKLLNYLLQFTELKNESCFQIEANDNATKLINIDDSCSIHILSIIGEVLYSNISNDISEFKSLCKLFKKLYINFNYPSELFDNYYQKFNTDQFNNGIYITKNITESESKINIDPNYIIFDPSVTEIKGDILDQKGPFTGCSSLSKIEFPSSLTLIGSYSFNKCTYLRGITIPSTVISIGQSAFSDCILLEEVEIPSSVTTIESYAFSGCSKLKKVEFLTNLLETIEPYVFNKCTSLKFILLPESVISIKSSAFNDCSSLKIVDIPSSVYSIAENAFNGCEKLVSINIPSKLTSIEPHVFSKCESLQAIDLLPTISSIEQYAFSECSSLRKVEIPSSVTSIESHTFNGCSSLAFVSIPSSVTSIKSYAFSGCTSLVTIEIPSSVTSIKSYAFSDCSSLATIKIPDSIKIIKRNTFSGCISLVKIKLPSSLESIGECAFYDCKALIEIDIPSSVTSIQPYTFCGCTSLVNVNIPSSVESINDHAFRGCESLRQISIPISVTSIDSFTFDDCSSLERISIPSSIANDIIVSSDVEISEI